MVTIWLMTWLCLNVLWYRPSCIVCWHLITKCQCFLHKILFHFVFIKALPQGAHKENHNLRITYEPSSNLPPARFWVGMTKRKGAVMAEYLKWLIGPTTQPIKSEYPCVVCKPYIKHTLTRNHFDHTRSQNLLPGSHNTVNAGFCFTEQKSYFLSHFSVILTCILRIN